MDLESHPPRGELQRTLDPINRTAMSESFPGAPL